MRSAPDRRGVVLVAVILLLLAATLLGFGTLAHARSFRQAGVEAWEAVRVRRAVTGRVEAAGWGVDTAAAAWVAAGPGVENRVQARPLSDEVVLLEGAGRGGIARWWVARVLWRGHPEARAAEVEAAARVGGVVRGPASAITGTDGTACAVDAGIAPRVERATGPPTLGPLSLEAWARRLPSWSLAPDPGACDGSTCPPTAGARTESARVEGGVHTGLIVVTGDLILSGDARVRGEVLVGGDLVLLDEARVEGSVRVGGDVVLAGTDGIRGDPCVIAEVWGGGVADAVGHVVLDPRVWPAWGGLP